VPNGKAGGMAEDIAIDWNAASVDDGRLTVPLLGEPSAKWRDRVTHVIERLERGGNDWGTIKVTKSKFRVDAVGEGAESTLRHLLEGAVMQANSDFREDDEHDNQDEPDQERSEVDQHKTDAFRSFSEGG
jgi:hypothetical protein